MKGIKPLLLAGWLMSLSLAAPVHAAPANPKHVAADAKWFIHLDADVLRQTTLFKQTLDTVRAQFPVEETMEQIKLFVGLNPLTDISGATIYNNTFEKDVAGVIVYAKYDKTQLSTALAQSPNFAESDYGSHKINTWTDANDSKHKAGCFYDETMVVLADRVDSVKLLVDVLDGKKPGGCPLVTVAPKGAFAYAAANLAEAGDANLAKMLSKSDAATAQVDEVAGKIRFTLAVTSKTPQAAALIARTAEGLRALGELAAHEMPTAAGLIHQIRVTANGAKVTATAEQDVATLFETIQKLDAENRARLAK